VGTLIGEEEYLLWMGEDTCRLFDGISREGNVVVSEPISPQITGEAATRQIGNIVIMVRCRCNQALTGS